MTDDATLLVQLTDEMQTLANAGAVMGATIPAVTVLQIVGLLQLALRHPEVSPKTALGGRVFIDGAIEFFHDCPAALEAIRRGDDPSEDPSEDLSE